MENKRLNSIQVKVLVNGNYSLVRQYNFQYNDSDPQQLPVFSPNDYGGIYYSGQFLLWKITQVGADGISLLPAMTFSYTSANIYYNDSANPTYNGNPGNPATLTWSYLNVVNSGYGGSRPLIMP